MKIKCQDLLEKVIEIFVKAGVPKEEAEIVSRELVEANMAGVHSHGVLRIPQYLDEIAEGSIKPGAIVGVIRETLTTAIVDCNHNFGQIGAAFMAEVVAEKAKASMIACAISVNANHIGRLGSYVERIARKGLLAFGMAAVFTVGPMAPFGGAEGKLGTNPIAFAVPRKYGTPVVLDCATTVVAEGKLRSYVQEGRDVPQGWIRDGYGNDTVKPMEFYGPPRGTILPMGGAKGSALAMMADIFTIALSNTDYWSCLPEKPDAQNGVFLMAVNPEAFFGEELFKEQSEKHFRFFKDTKPAKGFTEVLLPGEIEEKNTECSQKNGIELPDSTWNGLIEIAKGLNCEWSKELVLEGGHNAFVKL